jgi:general secretion pathway protein I
LRKNRFWPIGLRQDAGFTLLEVLIALSIMVVALGSIIAVQGSAINASFRAKQMNVVAMLAKNKMVEFEGKLEGKSFSEAKKEDTGTFETPFQDYSWKTEIKEIEFPQLSLAVPSNDKDGGKDSARSGGNAQGANDQTEMIAKLISKYISKAVREISVTILWKKGSADQSFSVSTYWVNLNHDFELAL